MGIVRFPPGHPFPAYRFGVDLAAGQVQRVRDTDGKYVHKRHVLALIEFLQDARQAMTQGRAGDAREKLEQANTYLLREEWAE